MLIFCAGKNRYSFPSPARFLIHGNSLMLGTGVPLDYNFLNSEMQQIQSLNQMVVQVVSATAGKKKQADIENAVRGQTILNPEQAKEWGIVTDVRDSFMEPGAVFVSVNTPVPLEEKKPASPYTTLKQPISSGPVTQ